MLTQIELETLLATAPTPHVAKVRIVKTVGETEWQIKAYSAAGDRIPAADCFESSKQAAHDTAKAMGARIIPAKRRKSAYAIAAESCGLVRGRDSMGRVIYE